MAYVKNTWVDQDVERPKTYEVTNNQDGSITLTDSFGLVTELGTPVNEVNMNHIEDGIDGCAIRKHNLTETFNLGEWVLGGTGDDEGIYKSLVSNNVGNAITDDTKWEKVEMGGNTRNIGEVVVSTIPLTDAGLHLLDGALVNGSGIYSAFVDYIAGLVTDYPDLFCTEADWQSEVAATGVCDKYVYDSVNNTVRLPKYGNQLIYNQSIPSTLGVKGNGKSMGITNGTANYGLVSETNNQNLTMLIPQATALNVNVGTSGYSGSLITRNQVLGLTRNSDVSGIITDTSTIISNNADVYYYIVIATTTKTDIEVDIDQIATDLNGKADIDLSNITDAGKIAASVLGYTSNSKAKTYAVGASGTQYTAPATGSFWVQGKTPANYTAGARMNMSNQFGLRREKLATTANQLLSNDIEAKKGDVITLSYSGVNIMSVAFVYAVGTESEAE